MTPETAHECRDLIRDAVRRLNVVFGRLASEQALVELAAPTAEAGTIYVTAADGLQFSRFADADGFVTIPAVDAFIATLPAKIRQKLPTRFAFEQAYRQATFPDDIAREKMARNMCARWRSPLDVPAFFSWDAKLFTVTRRPIDIKDDFNSLPEYRSAWEWSEDLAMQDGNRAYSADCNPATGPAVFLELVKVRAGAEQAPRDPRDTIPGKG